MEQGVRFTLAAFRRQGRGLAMIHEVREGTGDSRGSTVVERRETGETFPATPRGFKAAEAAALAFNLAERDRLRLRP